MKHYFFLGALCFLCNGNLEAQNYSGTKTPSQSPSVALPAEVASVVLGSSNYLNPNAGSRIFDCSALLNRSWAYSNAQMVLVCGEAETACIRYGMLQQTLLNQQQAAAQGQQGGFPMEALNSAIELCRTEVQFKIVGCAVSLESLSGSNASLLNKSGFEASTAPTPKKK